MAKASASRINDTIKRYEPEILREWMQKQLQAERSRTGVISEEALREESTRFLRLLSVALNHGGWDDPDAPAWDEARAMLGDVSRSRATQGFTPSETAWFVMSLKRPILVKLSEVHGDDAQGISDDVWRLTEVMDRLSLHTSEVFQKSREQIIQRQQQEMLELSTPVVQLWDGIVAVPLIGTLDSARTQVVMENLLSGIVDSEATIAIIDITGVPTVDTLVAQHLLRTVSAARLMGAECIISGIRPQIAQTIVHLGVDLGDITTKSTLADALRVGLARQGFTVGPARTAA